MPSRNEILERIRKGNHPDEVRREYLQNLSKFTGRDTILYVAGEGGKNLSSIPGNLLSIQEDDIQGLMSTLHGLAGEKLDLIIHSGGGSADIAEQIVSYLRSKYKNIRVIVPLKAMSAATMIACSADKIILGRQSSLGPIDPQMYFVYQKSRIFEGAYYILEEYKMGMESVKKDQTAAVLWAPRLAALPFGILSRCEKAIDSAKTLVEKWLVEYMKLDEEKASEIADWLGDAKEHSSHGRPITYDKASEKGLNVERLEEVESEISTKESEEENPDGDLQDLVLSVFHAAMITLEVTPCYKIIENQNGAGFFQQITATPTPAPMPAPRSPGR